MKCCGMTVKRYVRNVGRECEEDISTDCEDGDSDSDSDW